jgi:hypothetical protein
MQEGLWRGPDKKFYELQVQVAGSFECQFEVIHIS